MKTSVFAFAALALLPPSSFAETGPLDIPDFTKGAVIPDKATHDWNLEATGVRGWMFCDKMVTSDARQIAVTTVAKDSPADGVLAVGDVVLGVGGKPFSYDPRTEFGRALTAAESAAGGGALRLQRWRAGKTEEVVVKLPVLGSYSATAPYDCPKSQKILEVGCEALAKRVAAPGCEAEPITRALNALALLASGQPAYVPLVKQEAAWAAGAEITSFKTWYYGYLMMLIAEYTMATGDQEYLPGLQRLALEAAGGQSGVGSWGHNFALPSGRLNGYGMMNAPGVPLTIGLVMAREAGVKDPAVSTAIERSAKLLRFYIGKGAIPYGDHHPWTEQHDDNGKCGMGAVLFSLLGESPGAEFFSRMGVASHGPERDCGHTGNFFNILWSLPGIALSGPQATGAWMAEFGGWYFDLQRQWDGTFIHQGPPEESPDSYQGWDASGACLLAYAMPLRKIYLTGKRPSGIPQLKAAAAQSLIADGRGWNNKNRTSFYDQLETTELLTRLGSWSPTVRERAAMALARRKGLTLAPLLAMLESPHLETRYGVCDVLGALGAQGAGAVPALRQQLQHPDLWLRVKTADALAGIGRPAMESVPELLTMLARGPSDRDPRGMEQRYLCFAVFGKLLRNPLDGVDRDLLRKAIAAGLGNQDGRARGEVSGIYAKLSLDELKPLLPAIREAVVTPAPSGEMFASEVQLEGLKLFARHHISEGIEMTAAFVREQQPWASENRIVEILKLLRRYGAHAQRVIPQLEAHALYFDREEKDFPRELSLQKANNVRETIAAIKASTDRPELVEMASLVPAK
jgi:hypothetical protein